MASSVAGAPKRCYYEILGLSRDCSLTDIKLAFRRLALTLHPDKQPPGSDVAAATAAFQELQHAHSVLSDLHERAYYDSHRSQILFSDPSASASASPVPDLFAFFSSSAFSGFADTGRGFYKVYGDVFDKVFAQELAYARRMGVHEPASPPVIGNLDLPYAQVTAFYSYWLGFASVMDFGWAAEWDAARGENRRVRRLMEEDNKKAMRKARRDYNDAVRGLAAFCKKRDKRVVDMALKKKAEEEKRKAEERVRKKEEERRKKERAMAYQEPEWARVEEEEGVFDEEEEEEMRAKRKEELYCVACNKKFKSDKQWKNHEQSKKHRDKIAELRMVFKEEEESLKEEAEGDGDEVDVGFDFKPTQESDENNSEWSDAAEELVEELDSSLEVNDKEDSDKELGNAAQEVGSYDEVSVLEAMLSSLKNKTGGNVSPPSEVSSGGVELLDDDDISEFNNVKKRGRRRRASKKEQGESAYADNEQQRKPEVRPEESGHDNDENGVDDKMEGPSSSVEDAALASKGDQQKGGNSNPKKNKKDKKATERKTAVSTDQKSASKGKKQKEVLKEPTMDCETCGQIFESRNKLFSHLEETGHAMLKMKGRQKKR